MRRIDSKFRIDGEKILGPNGQEIPEDEPVFLLRGRDRLALLTLLKYKGLCAGDGCTDYQMDGIEEALNSFTQFAIKYPERMKQPGVTRGL